MSQEPLGSWFSDTTKFLHSCALTLVIFAIFIAGIVYFLEEIFT